MASPMAAVGLDVDDDGLLPLVRAVAPAAERLGEADGVAVLRWQDASGARLVLCRRGNSLIDVLPSFAGATRVRLDEFTRANDDVVFARVVDEHGEQITAAAIEVEERRLLDASGWPEAASASLVALGVNVTVHEDEAAFDASDASLFGPPRDDGDEPLRMTATSFLSFGVFKQPAAAEAFALLTGTVLRADRRTNTQTGQDFVVAQARSADFDVTLCLAASEHGALSPGNVVSGRFLLVGVGGRPRRRPRGEARLVAEAFLNRAYWSTASHGACRSPLRVVLSR